MKVFDLLYLFGKEWTDALKPTMVESAPDNSVQIATRTQKDETYDDHH